MFHDLMASYSQQANEVRQMLEEVRAQLDASSAPAAELPGRLHQAMLAWQQAYTDIRNHAGELLAADELPPADAPVTAYQSAVEGSKQLRLAATLKRFLRVRTAHNRYGAALEQAQTHAAVLLQSPDALTEEAMAPYEVFLKALALGEALNDDTDEANALLDAFEQYEQLFTSRLVNGLCGGAFTVAEEPASFAAEAGTAVSAQAEAPGQAEAAATESTSESAATEPAATEGASESAATEPAVTEDESESITTESEPAAAEETAQAEPACEAEPVEAEPTVTTRKPIGSHSLPSLQKLSNRISSAQEASVIEALGVMHVLTAELMSTARPFIYSGVDEAAAVMDMMESRGFLCSYDVDGECLYCCSPMLAACIGKNDRYQLLNERVHRARDDKMSEWRKPVLKIPHLVAKADMPLSALRMYRKQAGLVVDLLVNSAALDFTVMWNKEAGCCEVALQDVSPSVLPAVLPEEFFAAPADCSRPLLTTGTALPDEALMASFPAGCRYFVCNELYLWDGAAWALEAPKPEETEDQPVAEQPSSVEEPAPAEKETAAEAAPAPADEPAESVQEIAAAEESAPADEPAEPVQEISDGAEEAAAEEPAPDNEPAEPADAVPPEEEPAAAEAAYPSDPLLNGELNEAALQQMIKSSAVPSDELLASVVTALLSRTCTSAEASERSVHDAMLLAASAATDANDTQCRRLAAQLQMATGLLADKNPWNSMRLNEAFENGSMLPALELAAYSQAFFTPADAHDYGLLSQRRFLLENFDVLFPAFSEFKALFNLLLSVQDVSKHGFAPAVIAQLGNNAENEAYTQQLCSRAACYMEPAYTIAPTNTRERQAGIVGVYEAMFQVGSDLFSCMDVIAKNQVEDFDFVDSVLQEYCADQQEGRCIDSNKIIARIDASYREKRKSLDTPTLFQEIQRKAVNQVVIRLEIMKEWIEHVESVRQNAVDLTEVKRLRSDLLKAISAVREQSSWQKESGSSVLKMMLRRMHTRLMGTPPAMPFASLLHTGCFMQTDEGLPIIDASMNTVRFQEPWRLALKHIIAPLRPLDEVTDEILGNPVDDPVGVQDNLHQLTLIGRFLGDSSERYQIDPGQLQEATAAADDRMRDFRAKLELDYTYDRISESDKESLLQMMDHYKPIFFKHGDFACWHRFIDALAMQVNISADSRRQKLSRRLSAMQAAHPASQLLEAADRLLKQERNFAVAEEYMNRVDIGEETYSEELATILNDNDCFTDFIKPEVFEPLYAECSRHSGRAFRSFATTYVENQRPAGWSKRHYESSKALCANWPSRRGNNTPSSIQALFSAIGFDVVKAEPAAHYREEVFNLTINPTARSMADYRHPIAAFGTQLKSPLHVVILYGNFTERQLVDAVTSLDFREMSVVLLDRPLNVSQRRNIGELFHRTSGINPFILVDQVLALYLAMNQITERMSIMLKCTLPFTIYNPFVHDGGPTADEMFFGRTRELRSILDPDGACVVYGGRQLGKSALLARAESLFSKPEQKCFAVNVTVYECQSEEQFVAKVTKAINIRTDGKLTFSDCRTIQDFADQMEMMYRKNVYSQFLLLVDEADEFLKAIAPQQYKPLMPLATLRSPTQKSFKVVLAGLHNVYRAQSAIADNSVFGQLGTSLCVEPLTPADALQLLNRPLNYLGFRMDQMKHMETILTNTNYYPGILQFFGYKLVETMTTQYSRYYRAVAGNPPFELREEQLGAVMSSADLNNSIHHKFRLSLELDRRYYMIARCIAMLCHLYEEDGTALNWMGYSVQDVQQIAQEYDIHCLASADSAAYKLLMDEMVNMGILSRTGEGRYRLRRSSFIDVIGRDMNALEAEIIEQNGGAEA